MEREMIATEINQNNMSEILWELSKRTALGWMGTGNPPSHKLPYQLPDGVTVLAAKNNTLYYFRVFDGDMGKLSKEDFITKCIEKFGNRRAE